MTEESGLAMGGHTGTHRLGTVATHRGNHRDRRFDPPAKKIADRKTRRLAMGIPAGDVDRGLRRLVPEKGGIHGILNPVVASRIKPDDRRSKTSERGSHPAGMRRDIGAAKWCAFPHPTVPSSQCSARMVASKL